MLEIDAFKDTDIGIKETIIKSNYSNFNEENIEYDSDGFSEEKADMNIKFPIHHHRQLALQRGKDFPITNIKLKENQFQDIYIEKTMEFQRNIKNTIHPRKDKISINTNKKECRELLKRFPQKIYKKNKETKFPLIDVKNFTDSKENEVNIITCSYIRNNNKVFNTFPLKLTTILEPYRVHKIRFPCSSFGFDVKNKNLDLKPVSIKNVYESKIMDLAITTKIQKLPTLYVRFPVSTNRNVSKTEFPIQNCDIVLQDVDNLTKKRSLETLEKRFPLKISKSDCSMIAFFPVNIITNQCEIHAFTNNYFNGSEKLKKSYCLRKGTEECDKRTMLLLISESEPITSSGEKNQNLLSLSKFPVGTFIKKNSLNFPILENGFVTELLEYRKNMKVKFPLANIIIKSSTKFPIATLETNYFSVNCNLEQWEPDRIHSYCSINSNAEQWKFLSSKGMGVESKEDNILILKQFPSCHFEASIGLAKKVCNRSKLMAYNVCKNEANVFLQKQFPLRFPADENNSQFPFIQQNLISLRAEQQAISQHSTAGILEKNIWKKSVTAVHSNFPVTCVMSMDMPIFPQSSQISTRMFTLKIPQYSKPNLSSSLTDFYINNKNIVNNQNNNNVKYKQFPLRLQQHLHLLKPTSFPSHINKYSNARFINTQIDFNHKYDVICGDVFALPNENKKISTDKQQTMKTISPTMTQSENFYRRNIHLGKIQVQQNEQVQVENFLNLSTRAEQKSNNSCVREEQEQQQQYEKTNDDVKLLATNLINITKNMKRCSDEQQLAQSESSDLLFQQVINDEDETFAKTTTKTKTKTKTPAMSKNLAHLDIIYKNMSHQIANSSNDTLNAIATLDVLIDHQQICSDVRDTSLLVEVPVAVGTASETYPSIRLVLAQAISHENSLHKASILEKTESSAAEVAKNVSDCATPEKLTKEIQGLGKNIDESRQTEVINEKCVKSEKTDMTITKSISVESEEEYITESLTSSGIGAEELTEVEVNEMKYEMKGAGSATTQGRSSYKSDVPSSLTVRSKTPNSGLSDTKNINNDYSSSRLKNEIVTPTQTRLNTSIGFNSNRVKIDPKNPESVRKSTNVGYSSNAGVKSEPITHNVTAGTTNTYNKHNSNILSSTRNPPTTPYNSKNDVIQSSVPRRSSASAASTKRGVIDYTELGLRDTTNKRHSSGMDYTKDLSERGIRETANKRHSTGMDYTKDLTELGVREASNKRHSTGIDYTKDLTEFGLRDAANKRYSTGIDYTKDLSDFGTVKTPRKESEIKHSYSVDAMPSSLPTSTRLRRQRRMYSQDSADDSESALEKLNRLRARISGALSEVKGVLKQYSTETEAESDNTLDNKNLLESKKVDDGPVQFRFVKKVRRRSFFNEADEDAVKTVAENNATETKTEAMNSEIVSNKSTEEIKPININKDSQDSESGKLLDLKTVAANEESLDLINKNIKDNLLKQNDENNNEAKTVSENEKLENKSDECCNKINNNYITSENQISEQNSTSTIDEVDKAVSGSAKNDLNAKLQVVEHTRRLSPKLKNKDTNNKKSASEKLLPNSESINSVNKNKNKNLNLNSEVQNIESKRKLSPKLNKQETNKKIPLKVEENTKPSIHIKKDTSPMHENKKLNVESLKSESTADSSPNNNSHKKLVPNKNENSQISTTVADSSPNNNSHKKLVPNDNEKSQIRTTVAKNEAELKQLSSIKNKSETSNLENNSLNTTVNLNNLSSIKNETTKTSIINNNKLTKSNKLENEAVAMTEKIPTIKLEQGQQNDEKTLQTTVVEKSEKELIETISNVENLATPSLQQNSADNIISENKVTKLRSQNKNSNEAEKKRLSLKRNDSEIRRASIAAVEISKIIPSFDEETSVEIKLERRPSDSTAVVKKKVQGTSTKFASVMENDLATKVKKVTKIKRSSVKKNATDADVIAAVATTAHQQNTILTTNQITTEAKEAKTSATSIVVDNGELINENSLCNNKMLPITRTATQTPTEKPIINNQTKSMPNDASLTIAEVPMMPMMPIMPTTTTNDATEVIKSQNQNSVPQNLEISPTLQVPLQDGTVRSNSESAELKVVCETRTEPNNSEKLVKNIIKSKSEQDEKLTPPEKLITSTEENKYIDAEKIQNKTTTLIHSQELLDIKKPINQEIIPSETHDKQAQSSESQQVSIAAIANTNAAILQSENSTSADAVNERFKDATPKIISIATNVDATTKTESIDTAPNSVQVIVECNATDTSEETTTATEETMPELQVLPAPVVTAPQVGHKEHHSGKKKVIIKKLIRQCSKDKTTTAPPKANENTSLISETNIENNDINVIPPEELENAIEITTIETDVEVSTSEIEIPVAPPKKPRRVKKKVIIKRQQRKLSIGDTFFRGPEEEPVVSEIETLEKPIAYVTDDEDDDSMKEKNDEPVQPLKSCMKSREYQIGDIVLYAERFKKTQIRWKKGRVIERITSISYMLDIDGKEVPSHVNYLKKFTERKVNFGGKEYLEIDYEQIEEEERLARTYSIWNMV